MIAWRIPSADQQIGFLQRLQRLFEEGDFTSTYKYALLLALSELSVERGDDSGAPLDLPLELIAEKFAEFYWPQTLPYRPSDPFGGVLFQNHGQQAAVIGCLLELRSAGVNTFAEARRHPQWLRTINRIASVVRTMPVRYLQNLAGERVVFLYEPDTREGLVQLLPGVAFNLRQFQGFVQQFVRAGWIEHVRGNSRNAALLGTATDLEAFLFGTPRAALSQVAPVLKKLQNQRCFFCNGHLNSAAEVDHFIPWSRYPRDTALNFVLAHRACNQDKRELLAARVHLEHWLDRNERQGEIILNELQPVGFLPEIDVANRVAHWAYQQAVEHGSQIWLARGQTESINPTYLDLFADQK